MRPPAFWQRDGVPARLLSPAGAVYDAAGVLRRRLAAPRPAGAPVICVGNATVGGTGKTPVAIDLARRLQARGRAVHLLARGYGARLPGAPLRVDPARHTCVDVGDEALLLARAAPTWVTRDRLAGARAAVGAGAQVVVMDDGLQNPRLAKDLSLLVVDGATGFGNRRVLPAGPLRESLGRALARADAVVVMGRDQAGLATLLAGAGPVLAARLVAGAGLERPLRGRRVLAFAGIGRPAKFFDALAAMGAEVVGTRAFADHHVFSRAELGEVLAGAESAGAVAVTTEKDAARLPAWARARVAVLPVAVEWRHPDALERLLAPIAGDAAA